jgi:hypothetical protein
VLAEHTTFGCLPDVPWQAVELMQLATACPRIVRMRIDSLTLRFLTGFSGSLHTQNCACFFAYVRQENGTAF